MVDDEDALKRRGKLKEGTLEFEAKSHPRTKKKKKIEKEEKSERERGKVKGFPDVGLSLSCEL